MSHNGEGAAYDVGVIGGGVVACAVGKTLATNGKKVIIFRDPIGNQIMASRAAGALLGIFSECSSKDSEQKRHLDVSHRLAARKMYDSWISTLVEESGVNISTTKGLFIVANSAGANDIKELEVIRLAANEFREKVEEVSPRDIPGLLPKRGFWPHSAVFIKSEGTVDTGNLLIALEQALIKHKNVTIIDSVAIDIKKYGLDSVITCQNKQLARCREVVLAGGAMMTNLLANLETIGLNLPPIFAGRGVGIIIRSNTNYTHCIRTPNRGFACGIHLVPRSDANLYLGSTNRLTTSVDRVGYPILSEINNLLAGGIDEINSTFGRAELVSASVGYRPVTIDSYPLVGRTNLPGVLIATGTYRNGILLAPLIAKLIAEEINHPGTHANHPFAINKGRFSHQIKGNIGNWIDDVSTSLIETITEPGGSLPYNREVELRNFFKVALGTFISDDKLGQYQLTSKVKRLLRKAPMTEVAPLIFELIARHKQEYEKD